MKGFSEVYLQQLSICLSLIVVLVQNKGVCLLVLVVWVGFFFGLRVGEPTPEAARTTQPFE